jgi:phosphatidylethanolamine-binding protein (PEBP) family uncharacterized protein
MLETIMALALTSSAFTHNGPIPRQYTCQGGDVSVPIAWTGIPEAAKSLALIVDDPDAPDPAAPKRTWVHWVLYNLPVTADGLKQAVKATELPAGTLPGKLHALDTILPNLAQPTKAELERAMDGHVLERFELVGTYQKD